MLLLILTVFFSATAHFFIYLFYVCAPFYLDPEGKVIEAIWNEGTKHPQVKYYYSSAQECMTNNLLYFLLHGGCAS